jgi:hypothetical protein
LVKLACPVLALLGTMVAIFKMASFGHGTRQPWAIRRARGGRIVKDP